MAVKMRALKRFRFPEYGRMRNVGDVFEVQGTMRPGSVPAVLKALGRAEEYREPVAPPAYLTRAMTAAPVVEPVAHTYRTHAVEVAAPSGTGRVEVAPDSAPDLDAMEKEELHALAVELGVKVHHAAGAPKVRQAIREAQG